MTSAYIPFTKFNDNDIARPWLPVTIHNPHTKLSIKVYGLIDTGADECAIPAEYAPLLGHNLQAGIRQNNKHRQWHNYCICAYIML